MKKNCVYRFLNCNNEIIYVGKATDLDARFKSSNHNHLPTQCYIETIRIEFTSFNTEYEMDLAERYFIPRYKPKYNTQLGKKDMEIELSEFEGKKWNEYIFPNSQPRKPKSIKTKNGIEVPINITKYCFVRTRGKNHLVYIETNDKKQLLVKSYKSKKDAFNLVKKLREIINSTRE